MKSKSDLEIYLEQQTKLRELSAYKNKCTFLQPVKKAPAKQTKPQVIKQKPVKKPFELKQQEKTPISLDHMEHLIKKIDQNYTTFKEDQKVNRKSVKIELPKTPLTQKLTKAIEEKLGIIVKNNEDLLLTTNVYPNLEKQGLFGFLREKNRVIIYIEDLNQLEQIENKKLLWKLLSHHLKLT